MKKNTTTKIHVGITDNYFNALSKQNLPMSSAACEIVDNTISNSKGPINSLVAVEEGSVKGMLALIFADWGTGMTIEPLEAFSLIPATLMRVLCASTALV